MLLLKFAHVLFLFIWLGTLLAVTRLMAYQAKETPDVQLRLGRICRRMYLVSDLPAMILAVGTGISLLILKDIDFKAPWFHMKMTFAFLLIALDIFIGRRIVRASFSKTGTSYKILHGISALFLIGILASIYILKQRNL